MAASGAPSLHSRRDVRRAVRRAALIVSAVLALAIGAMPTGAQAIEHSAAADSADIAVDLDAGLGGVIPGSDKIPLRVVLNSPRSVGVRVDVETPLSTQHFDVDVNAGAPTNLDVSVYGTSGRVDVTVRNADGDKIGTGTTRLKANRDVATIGVGGSIAAHRAPWTVAMTTGIQKANLIPLAKGLLERPGVLDALDQLILGPADLDRLSDAQRRSVAMWVSRGGVLSLDQARSKQLPVLDIDAEPGDRTAVGAGWVVFTNGKGSAGVWGDIVEPVTRSDSADQMFVDEGFNFGKGFGDMVDSQLGSSPLINAKYVSTSVVIPAVFLTALVVGPILYLLLRSRSRRRWMWFLAPGISLAVAGALLFQGQGVLSDASSIAYGDVLATPWGSNAFLSMGSTKNSSIDLGSSGVVWGSKPVASVRVGGGELRAGQTLNQNQFGYLGVDDVEVDENPMISVAAEATDGGQVKVSVTNHTNAVLTSVAVSGFTRSRPFTDVAPGATESLPFEVSKERGPLGAIFPPDSTGNGCIDANCMFGGRFTGPPSVLAAGSAMGRIKVAGSLIFVSRVGGESRSTIGRVVATAPVTIGDQASIANAAALVRLDTVAPLVESDGQTPTVSYVRLSSPVAVSRLTCSTHTAVSSVDEWNGSQWIELAKIGEPRNNERLLEPNQTQDYELNAVVAGETRYLRLHSMIGGMGAAALGCGLPK